MATLEDILKAQQSGENSSKLEDLLTQFKNKSQKAFQPNVPAIAQTEAPINLPKPAPQVLGEGMSRAAPIASDIADAELVEKATPAAEAATAGRFAGMAAPIGHNVLKIAAGIDPVMLPPAVAAAQNLYSDVKDAIKGPAKITQPNIPEHKSTGPDDVSTPPVYAPEQNTPTPAVQAKYEEPEKEETQTDSSQTTNEVALEPSKSGDLLNQFRTLASMKSDKTTDLREAQNKTNQNELYANLLKGLNTFNSGITGSKVTGPAKVDNSALDALAKNANAPIEQYLQRVKDEPNDPSSRYSNIMRSYFANKLKAAGIDVDSEEYKNMSGADIAALGKFAQQDEANKLKAEYKNMVRGHIDAQKQQQIQDRQDKEFDNNVNRFVTQLDKIQLSGRMGPAAKNLVVRDAADRIDALLAGVHGDYNKLTNQQVYEVAKSMDNMLSSGGTTVEGTKHLNPATFPGKLADLLSKATADPQGAGEGKFVELYKHTIDRERDIAQQKLTNFFNIAKESIPERQYNARKKDYDRILEARLKNVNEQNLNFEAPLQGHQTKQAPLASNEIRRLDPKTGKTIVYDAVTKKPLRAE